LSKYLTVKCKGALKIDDMMAWEKEESDPLPKFFRLLCRDFWFAHHYRNFYV
jgi:hypothetical protein